MKTRMFFYLVVKVTQMKNYISCVTLCAKLAKKFVLRVTGLTVLLDFPKQRSAMDLMMIATEK